MSVIVLLFIASPGGEKKCSAYQHPAGWSEGRRRHLSQKASVQASSFRKLRFARCSLANRQFEKVARHALKREMSPAERSCNRNVRKVGEVTSVRASSDLPTHLGSVMTISVHIDARSGAIECLALYLVHSPRELWVQKALLIGNPQIEKLFVE